MKARIFLYLFLFAFMVIIYQYANSKKFFEAKEKTITHLEEKISRLETSLAANELTDNRDWDDFSLKDNAKVREYLEDQNIDPDSLAGVLEYEIISRNLTGNDNELVPFPGIQGTMKVNKIKVLNSKWIIAEFTDGTYWGQALISYYFDDQNQLQFNTDDGVLYGF